MPLAPASTEDEELKEVEAEAPKAAEEGEKKEEELVVACLSLSLFSLFLFSLFLFVLSLSLPFFSPPDRGVHREIVLDRRDHRGDELQKKNEVGLGVELRRFRFRFFSSSSLFRRR